MASKFAAAAAQSIVGKERLFDGKARNFYLEVCRCLPFIHRLMNAEEVVTRRDLRRIVKERFEQFKDAKDPRTVDMLIFKGREELETYLYMHKQRHHLITEYIEPYAAKQAEKTSLHKPSGASPFLDSFFETGYNNQPQKYVVK